MLMAGLASFSTMLPSRWNSRRQAGGQVCVSCNMLGCSITVQALRIAVCQIKCARSDLAQQELLVLLQQASIPDAHTNFNLSSGGETWEQNVRRIATDVVCVVCEAPAQTETQASVIAQTC